MRGKWVWVALGLWGCASIQAPDGGPPDTTPPQLRRIRVKPSAQGVRLVLIWDEYLSPGSELGATGLWVNPAYPFQARLRGKRLLFRLDSVAGAVAVWGGPGLKDFTEGNRVAPQLLWQRYPSADTIRRRFRLEPPPDTKSPVWAEFRTDSGEYRFLAWQGEIETFGLPKGTYSAWAWADADANQRWDAAEPVWLPDPYLRPEAPDSATGFIEGAWRRGQLDTLPPTLPRPALRDSLWGLFVAKEPLSWQLLSGSGRALSEEAFLVQVGSAFALYDSAGNAYRDTFLLGQADTQAFRVQLFWPIAANLVLPQLYLTSSVWQAPRETLWVGRVRDTLWAARVYREAEELYLEPLVVEGEAHLSLEVGQETLEVRLPARKYAVPLPIDSVGEVQRWRIYGPWPLGEKGAAWALPGQTIWLPAGTYELIGLAEKSAFWQPVQLVGGIPVYRQPIRQALRLVVPPPSPAP